MQKEVIMDVGSKHGYPASALSNFSPHPFTFRGIEVASMEGFLQGLKFKNPEMQKHVFGLVGFKAKNKGKDKNWKTDQTLYFQEQPLERESDEYAALITEAYDEMFKNEKFKAALKAAGDAVFTHKIGKSNPKETVLTEREFCRQLTRLRNSL
jgi:hypothetical protein